MNLPLLSVERQSQLLGILGHDDGRGEQVVSRREAVAQSGIIEREILKMHIGIARNPREDHQFPKVVQVELQHLPYFMTEKRQYLIDFIQTQSELALFQLAHKTKSHARLGG